MEAFEQSVAVACPKTYVDDAAIVAMKVLSAAGLLDLPMKAD
jgi:hypothetical protein